MFSTRSDLCRRRLSELSEQTKLKKSRSTPMGQITTTSKREIDKVLRKRDTMSFKEYVLVSDRAHLLTCNHRRL